jgi:hypothetical protein
VGDLNGILAQPYDEELMVSYGVSKKKTDTKPTKYFRPGVNASITD